jgi:hypothetical protein
MNENSGYGRNDNNERDWDSGGQSDAWNSHYRDDRQRSNSYNNNYGYRNQGRSGNMYDGKDDMDYARNDHDYVRSRQQRNSENGGSGNILQIRGYGNNDRSRSHHQGNQSNMYDNDRSYGNQQNYQRANYNNDRGSGNQQDYQRANYNNDRGFGNQQDYQRGQYNNDREYGNQKGYQSDSYNNDRGFGNQGYQRERFDNDRTYGNQSGYNNGSQQYSNNDMNTGNHFYQDRNDNRNWDEHHQQQDGFNAENDWSYSMNDNPLGRSEEDYQDFGGMDDDRNNSPSWGNYNRNEFQRGTYDRSQNDDQYDRRRLWNDQEDYNQFEQGTWNRSTGRDRF